MIARVNRGRQEAIDLAEAHRKDMLLQDEYNCRCMSYWLDETRGVLLPDRRP